MTSPVEEIRSGNRRTLARLLTRVENEDETLLPIMNDLFTHTGNAHVVGITGAPGTGKSTLVSALASAYRRQEKTVAILAVDPTSPFSGGAVLGDRIRMNAHAGDKGVFIRSMATRGTTGGLSRTAQQAIWVLDAAGYDVVIVETVGAGQSEVDIVKTAHTTLVLEAPGLGDGVQSIKAGILEIADILVVNKADRPGAINTVRTLRAMLELGHPTKNQAIRHHGQLMPVNSAAAEPENETLWIPPVIETVATEEKGVDDLVKAIEDHRDHQKKYQADRVHHDPALRTMFHNELQNALLADFLQGIPAHILQDVHARIQNRSISPQQAAKTLLNTYHP